MHCTRPEPQRSRGRHRARRRRALVRARIASIENLSAHADYAEILVWLKNFPTPPRKTFVTHGEPVAADALRHRIEEELRWSCRVPEYFEAQVLG
jgi:metallo-beta-lactamase family protein